MNWRDCVKAFSHGKILLRVLRFFGVAAPHLNRHLDNSKIITRCAAGLAYRAINRISIAITNCYRTAGGQSLQYISVHKMAAWYIDTFPTPIHNALTSRSAVYLDKLRPTSLAKLSCTVFDNLMRWPDRTPELRCRPVADRCVVPAVPDQPLTPPPRCLILSGERLSHHTPFASLLLFIYEDFPSSSSSSSSIINRIHIDQGFPQLQGQRLRFAKTEVERKVREEKYASMPATPTASRRPAAPNTRYCSVRNRIKQEVADRMNPVVTDNNEWARQGVLIVWIITGGHTCWVISFSLQKVGLFNLLMSEL